MEWGFKADGVGMVMARFRDLGWGKTDDRGERRKEKVMDVMKIDVWPMISILP